jgi:DNA invertase Pin-like site-specific DNA recombinase
MKLFSENDNAGNSSGQGSECLSAAYVRMSTDHQQYSTDNQMDVIREDARRRGLEIVKLFSDEGKSGLNFEGRDALKAMVAEVEAGQATYSNILVYDVSRWGRFQDPDESAHYEYICRKAGVAVHYCAEPFENDGSPISAIVKSVKRAMAGEYSRELSKKVFVGACRIIRMGYKQGGTAIYGLRRVVVDQDGRRKYFLKMGERKSLQTDRVIFVPGPAEEVKIVGWIFEAFAGEGRGETEIARLLNEQGVVSDLGMPWTDDKIRRMLQNEKYIGNLVYARYSCKLRTKQIPNAPHQWIRKEGAFDCIVPRELFFRAQSIYRARRQRLTDAEMLQYLRSFLDQHGHLSCALLNRTKAHPTAAAFKHRFGSLVNAYRLIGFDPRIDYSHLEIDRRLLCLTRELVANLISRLGEVGASVGWRRRSRLMVVNQEVRVRVALIRHSPTDFGASRWVIRCGSRSNSDLILAARMDRKNEKILDYYLFPSLDPAWRKMRLAEHNGVYLDSFRFQTLDALLGLTLRTKLSHAL